MEALEKQEECEVQSESVHEPQIQAPGEVLSANDQDPPEAQNDEDENESDKGHVPLELFAEVKHLGHIINIYIFSNT